MRKFRAIIMLFLFLLSSVPVLAANQVFIPHLTDGNNQWGDYLTIDNTGLEPADVVVTLYDIDGYQIYRGQHSVGSMGETLINVRDFAGSASSGKVEIPDGGDIHCRLSLESLVGGGVAEFRLDASQSSILAFLYSDFLGATVWKGLAVTNYGDVAGEITFYAYGNEELLATSEPFDIAAHEKFVGVPSQWFSEIDSNVVKKIIAVSTVDTLGGLAIAGDTAVERLLFTAAVPLDNFHLPEVIEPPVESPQLKLYHDGRESSLPYSCRGVMTAIIIGSPTSTYTLGKFKLEAIGDDFTITNVSAKDRNSRVSPYFVGLSNGTVISAGNSVNFKLVSPLTRGATAELVFSFKVVETGETFLSTITFRSN